MLKVLFALILIILQTRCYVIAQPTVPQAEVEMAAATVVQRELEYYNAHNLKGFLSTYADSIRIHNLLNDMPKLQGLDAMAKTYKFLDDPANHFMVGIGGRVVAGRYIADIEEFKNEDNSQGISVAMYEVSSGKIVRVQFLPSQQYADAQERSMQQTAAAALFQANWQGLITHNAAAFLNCFADSITLYSLPTLTPLIQGKAALAKDFAARPANLQLHLAGFMVAGRFIIAKEEQVTASGVKVYLAIYEVQGGKISRVWFPGAQVFTR